MQSPFINFGLPGPFARRRGRGAALDPASLFANGEQGDDFWFWRDFCFTLSSGGVYEPVTTTGDQIARITGTVKGINADQNVAEDRPVYGESGSIGWAQFDGVDDQLRFPDGLVGEGTWSFAMAYQPDGNDFLMLHRGSSNPWIGIGQKDSTSTSISGSGASKNAFYVNNVADTSGNRGGQYSAAQGGSRLLVDFNTSTTTWSQNAKIGSYSGGSFTTPGDVYAMLLIDRSLTEDERGLVDDYLAGRVSA